MRIFLICSKHHYPRVPLVQEALESAGHVVILPNSYDNPKREEEMRKVGPAQHAAWKGEMLKKSAEIIGACDAVCVLNFEKNGVENYIGGATFLEMYEAFCKQKKIYLYNSLPSGMLHDEILAFSPILLEGDVGRIV